MDLVHRHAETIFPLHSCRTAIQRVCWASYHSCTHLWYLHICKGTEDLNKIDFFNVSLQPQLLVISLRIHVNQLFQSKSNAVT